ncbi:MAG: hypothetical protein HQL46_11100 [Gammaproteobacteria bacterium]|nr:hypothetical protein [Gammaproteobacteria bacterium]
MDIYLDFIFSSILLFGLVAVYEFAINSVTFPNKNIEILSSGIAIGLMTVAILSTPVHIDKGIFVDARWVLLSCTAIFLNWRIILIGGMIAAGFRYFQGGAGAVPGVMTVITAMAVGFLWRYILVSYHLDFKWYMHYIFAVVLELIIIFVIYIFMPDGKGSYVASVIWIPLMIVFPIVSTLLSLLLQHHWKRQILAFE